MTERLARACSRHPWRAIGGWIVAVVLAVAALALLLGDLTTEGHPTNNPESQRATALIAQGFPPDPSRETSDLVVISSTRYTVDDPQYRAFVVKLVAAGRATGGVANARVYYRTHDKTQISSDRHAMLIPIVIPDTDDAGAVEDVAASADRDAAFNVAVTGDQTIDNDFNELSQHDLKSGELQFGIPAALVILILVFGAIVAGLVPLLMAIISIIVALGLVAVLSQPFNLSVFIINMLTGMGLALGIDYSLFVVSRYREERAGGRVQFDAIGGAGATASRAVLVSGTAFVVAMCGMLIVPNNVMRSLALGAILVGVVSVVAALTLLPALLGLLGDRVNALRLPYVGRSIGSGGEGRFWGGVVRAVMRRPVIYLVTFSALLLALAIPAIGLKLGASGVSTLPDRLGAKQGFEALAQDFPQASSSPALITVSGDMHSPQVRAAIARLRASLARDPAFGRSDLRFGNGVAAIGVEVGGDKTGEQALDAVRHLRSTTIPEAFRGTDAQVLVGGDTADNVDYIDAMTAWLPPVFAFVLGLSFILLTIAFRSIVVAATSMALSLLSVGAAYGLVVLVFLHGIGSGLFGFQRVDAIDAWVPLFLFSVLFGLSMDYQVFLLSRIKERYDVSGSTREAVEWGVSSTARLITGAALIIVAVFSGFAMGDLVMFQQMGFGIAVALLIDATIIRSVLLPAAMVLLGKWNWYLPTWLEWLPHIQIEAAEREKHVALPSPGA